ncbi:MAG: TylF/MycF/NovP-related O-methyltransferase [Tepidisphaeraceae bacterium]
MSDRQWRLQFGGKADIAGMDAGPRKGRVPKDGYLRACGLQFGNIPSLCMNDPDFQAAMTIASERTEMSPIRLMNLYMLVTFYLANIPAGHIVEFGTYKGGSALFMAYLASRYLPQTRVFAFDTFAGMPETDRGVDGHKAGDFSDTSLETLRELAQSRGLTNLEFIPGRFEESAPAAMPRIGKIALAHIDCDIYSAVRFSYDACKPLLVPGGYVVFDDPLDSCCLGALEAVEDCVVGRDGLRAEQAFPHLVFRHPAV